MTERVIREIIHENGRYLALWGPDRSASLFMAHYRATGKAPTLAEKFALCLTMVEANDLKITRERMAPRHPDLALTPQEIDAYHNAIRRLG